MSDKEQINTTIEQGDIKTIKHYLWQIKLNGDAVKWLLLLIWVTLLVSAIEIIALLKGG